MKCISRFKPFWIYQLNTQKVEGRFDIGVVVPCYLCRVWMFHLNTIGILLVNIKTIIINDFWLSFCGKPALLVHRRQQPRLPTPSWIEQKVRIKYFVFVELDLFSLIVAK